MDLLIDGNCNGMDPNKFMPSEKEVKKERTAKAICQGCPVRKDCLEFALLTDSVGIWAGSNYSERQLMMLIMPELKPSRLAESFHNGKTPLSQEHTSGEKPNIGHIPTLTGLPVSEEFLSEPYQLEVEELSIQIDVHIGDY